MFQRVLPLLFLLLGVLSGSCDPLFGDGEDPDTMRISGAGEPVAVGSRVFLGFYFQSSQNHGDLSYGSFPVLAVTFSDPAVARVIGVTEESDGLWLEVVGEGTGTLKVTFDETWSPKQTTSVQITAQTPTGLEFQPTCTGAATLPGAVYSLPYALSDEEGDLAGSINHRATILAPDGSVLEPLPSASWSETLEPWTAALEFTPVPGIVTVSVEGFPEATRQIHLLDTTTVEVIELTNVETNIRDSGEIGVVTGELVLHAGDATVCMERSASEILHWEVLSGDAALCALAAMPEWSLEMSPWRIENRGEGPCTGELSLGEGSIAPPVTVDIP